MQWPQQPQTKERYPTKRRQMKGFAQWGSSESLILTCNSVTTSGTGDSGEHINIFSKDQVHGVSLGKEDHQKSGHCCYWSYHLCGIQNARPWISFISKGCVLLPKGPSLREQQSWCLEKTAPCNGRWTQVIQERTEGPCPNGKGLHFQVSFGDWCHQHSQKEQMFLINHQAICHRGPEEGRGELLGPGSSHYASSSSQLTSRPSFPSHFYSVALTELRRNMCQQLF